MRLFIAIDFTDEIKISLYGLTQELKIHTSQGHFTHKENFHLTLAFIGETKDFDHVIQAIDNAVLKGKISPFYLNVGGFGRFKGRAGDIFWVGVEQNTVLTELNNALVRELKKFEFKIEDKEFKPHLTLGREIVLKNGYAVKDFEKLIPVMSLPVDGIELMKSERIDGKLVYTEVYHRSFMENQ